MLNEDAPSSFVEVACVCASWRVHVVEVTGCSRKTVASMLSDSLNVLVFDFIGGTSSSDTSLIKTTFVSGNPVIITMEWLDSDWGSHKHVFPNCEYACAAVQGKARGAGSHEDR
ncbi:hypothetical protein CRG98_006409 [Punica granatum]|uniref:Uncharacterized protein n=1 Tax=Punica granatum TaxID=22663 RepID=A0A2I0KXK2_PUNGR|nr:hypothetical protein CRG98_006409 [Punica granatum]